MQQNIQPIVKDLVLIGGGHSHAIALRMFGMKPLPGVRLTLISVNSDTPYSGMLPGHVAGFYPHDECHIDLRKLANFAQAQLYIDRVVGIDLVQNLVICAHRPPVAFDLLSVDIGSTPATVSVPGAAEYAIPAKPVSELLQHWYQCLEEISQQKHLEIGIVGGGAGGVELALAMQRLIGGGEIHLFGRDRQVLPHYYQSVKWLMPGVLRQRGIKLHLGESVCKVATRPQEKVNVVCESGLTVECDRLFWVTQASAPSWIAASGIETDSQGFIAVNDKLQSLSHPHVFAAGDIATMVNHPRAKAGVFAVRQGKPLFENLRRSLLKLALKTYIPQQNYLSLIGTGDGKAIANRGWLTLPPLKLLWQWKDHIDRKFMNQFSDLPSMEPEAPPIMHCAGCGSKVGSSVLENVLSRIQLEQSGVQREDIIIGLDVPDDASVVRVPSGMVMVQTIDYFRSLINDPYIFGQIAANHCLSDIFAMGATPQSALAIATIPYAAPAPLQETLYQLLSGAIHVLNQAQASLIGGHTTEGTELAFGLTCNGLADEQKLLPLNGMQPGQVIILTKSLGSGALFAADMRREAKARWIDAAVKSMLLSNQVASACLQQYGATACTDVTGFGLLGHLLTMVRASKVAVELELGKIPVLLGARETVEKGIFSSLYPENLQASRFVEDLEPVKSHPYYPLLFDPQTSGGLLASVAEVESDRCVEHLRKLGYKDSCVIGRVIALEGNLVTLTQ